MHKSIHESIFPLNRLIYLTISAELWVILFLLVDIGVSKYETIISISIKIEDKVILNQNKIENRIREYFVLKQNILTSAVLEPAAPLWASALSAILCSCSARRAVPLLDNLQRIEN